VDGVKLLQSKKTRKVIRFIPMYLMMVPGIIYFFINNYMPMPGILMAFKNFKYTKGIWNSPWCAFKNFTFLVTSQDLSLLLRNTLLYNLVFMVLGTILAVTVAILLNEVQRKKLQQTFQTLILIPYLMSYVIIAYIVYALFGAEYGMINNSILKPLGVASISWYTEDKYWPVILTCVNLWKSFGYSSIIYYATLVGFDKSYYEAAMVDGATTMQMVFRITLPLLKHVIIMLTLFSIGYIFYSDFGLFYQVPMNSGQLYNTTSTIDTYVYRGLLEDNNIGRASAASFIQSIAGFLCVISANAVVRKLEAESALF
jgi:putative aldouronate transport system permease protein